VKQLYIDIRTKVLTLLNGIVPAFNFVQVWNNQLETDGENKMYSFAYPALFVEIVSPGQIIQLGNGVQHYEPLIVRLHILQEFYNATDGNGILEQDLTIFDLRQIVYEGMQGWEPDNCVAWVRTGETQDTNHSNVYHFIQEYTTSYVDSTMERPVDGLTKTPPTDYSGVVSKVDVFT